MSSRSEKIFALLKTVNPLEYEHVSQNSSIEKHEQDYRKEYGDLDNSSLVGSPESVVSHVSGFRSPLSPTELNTTDKCNAISLCPLPQNSRHVEAEPLSLGNSNLSAVSNTEQGVQQDSSVNIYQDLREELLFEDSDDSIKDPDFESTNGSDTESSESETSALLNSSGLQGKQNGEHGSKENAEEFKKAGKRKRNTTKWKCNIRKQKRLSGEEYVSKRNTLVAAKSLGPPCKDTWRHQCITNISQVAREDIFNNFWSSSKTIDLKRQFVASCVHLVAIKRRCERTGERANKKTSNKKFTFSVNGVQVEVCKTFFLNTLGISQTFVSTAMSKKVTGGMVESDKRGKKIPPNKISVEVKDSIRNHILKFATVESHYSRERSSKKYLDSSLNISKMYELYKQDMLDKNAHENEIPKLWLYTEIFNNEFNYSFKLPDNDTCDKCDKYLVKLKESSPEERMVIQKEYDDHLNEAGKRYSLKSQDKINGKVNKKQKVLTVDLEKCLPTLALTNAQSFYSLKLWTFNYTIKDTSNNHTTYCMWDESVAGRGGNEIASCLLKWAVSNAQKPIEEVTIWSDNCPSQNRNINSVLAYCAILKLIPTLKIINHKYLLRGHTHLEVDSDHSLIERARKKMTKFQIMTPWDWQQLVRLASTHNPFSVINMETSDFRNFMSLIEGSSAPFLHRKKYESGKDFKISQLVHIQFRSDEQGKVFCKSAFDEKDFEVLDLNRISRRSIFPDEIPLIRNVAKPITDKKYKDLQNLLQWIPKMFHTFYQNLPRMNKDDEDINDD